MQISSLNPTYKEVDKPIIIQLARLKRGATSGRQSPTDGRREDFFLAKPKNRHFSVGPLLYFFAWIIGLNDFGPKG